MTMLKPRSGMRLTVEEFMDLPETDDRRKMELDEGVLYIMVKPGLVHQFFQSRLTFYFESYLEEFDEPPAHVFTEVIVALSLERRTLLAPDLSIILVERSHLLTTNRIEGRARHRRRDSIDRPQSRPGTQAAGLRRSGRCGILDF